MRYRKLGQTKLLVSEISFGTIPILKGCVPVLPDYYNLSLKQAIDVMMYAYNMGCNLFDTAIVPEYGDAEIKLGLFAKKVDREKIIISDKARFFDGNEIYKAVETSIKNLGTYPDIYFVHQVDPKNVDITFSKYGALDALVELKNQDKIKFTGVASHYYDILLKGANDKRVDVLQGSGNILERGMIDRIEQNQIFRSKGFILNKVYAAGILLNYFSEYTLVNSMLSYPISSAVIGLGRLDHIKIIMYDLVYDYNRISFSDVICFLEKSFNPIRCDRCQKCICTYDIDISRIFRQYNYFFLGKQYWALKKIGMDIENVKKSCSNCANPICIKSCPKNIFIPAVLDIVYNFYKLAGF